jgi:DNA-binding transcriptional ArsR family regulator
MMDKSEKYERSAALFSALSNPIRLMILDTLASCCSETAGGPCVCEINQRLGLPQPYISKHLKILKECGILEYSREGNKIIYRFAGNGIIAELLECLEKYKGCC